LKKLRSIVLGIILGFLGSAGIWIASSPPRGDPIQLQPAPTIRPIQVHITGAVVHPGVYTLTPTSRIHDAIEAAGGFTSDANEQGINLVAPLEDGLQIRVPYVNSKENKTTDNRNLQSQSTTSDSTTPHTPYLININTATCEELETLPGIGPVIAEAIITHRETKGEFNRIEDIQKVPGIGPTTYEDIKSHITVTDGS
jgi:competence protein ComEA